jgi:hypothetical protein
LVELEELVVDAELGEELLGLAAVGAVGLAEDD